MEQNDWQNANVQQHRQRMPETPSHQNVRRYSHQPMQAPQQSPMQVQPPQSSNSSQYAYATPTRSEASPSSRHSITSEFSGINIRDDPYPSTVEKSARPNLSVHPSGLRPSQGNHQGSVPSSPTRPTVAFNTANYSSGNPTTHPGISRTTSDETRHFVQQQPSNSRHSSPMHTVSPSLSPYYPNTPHTLNSINEGEQTMSWSQGHPPTRGSPSRSSYAFPASRDSASPRSQLHPQQSPSTHRHSMSHIPTSYDSKAQYSPRQATHFPATTLTASPTISPTSFSPRHATFAMNRDAGSMMSDIVYSTPLPAKFRRIGNTNELNPVMNGQPKYRRANPDGGFISVLPQE
jgi:dual specificity protein kinase YAK1